MYNYLITKFRVSMSCLRFLTHRLSLDTGRWTKPNLIPVNERICLTCNVLEDEYHFVLECPLYNDLWNDNILIYYRRRLNMQTFIKVIANENENVIKDVCLFTKLCYQIPSLVENVWLRTVHNVVKCSDSCIIISLINKRYDSMWLLYIKDLSA